MFELIKAFLVVAFFSVNFTKCENIDSLDALRKTLSSSKTAIVAFYSNANIVSTNSIFKDIKLNSVIVSNLSAILEGVKNGTFLAGCVHEYIDTDTFNSIKTGILTGHGIFILPDKTTEYPYGASIEQSRKQFRNAINLAIVNLQSKGIDFALSEKYKKPISDLRTCKLNNPDEFPLPNRSNASGLLKEILQNRVLLVGSFGDQNTSPDSDENNQEFPFQHAYLNAIIDEFGKLSGPDKVPYGQINIQRVYAKSSTVNLLRGRVHMTEPYFLIDNVYSGSKEKCSSDTDCILSSDTNSGHENCINSTCVVYSRPITEIFKVSCLTYGTENLFATKKISSDKSDSGSKVPGGIIAALVLLSLIAIAAVLLILFMVWRERLGTPLFG